MTAQTVVHQAPLFIGFSKQVYWRGLPFPPAGDLPDLGTELLSLVSFCIGRWVLYHCATWEALHVEGLLKYLIIFVCQFMLKDKLLKASWILYICMDHQPGNCSVLCQKTNITLCVCVCVCVYAHRVCMPVH